PGRILEDQRVAVRVRIAVETLGVLKIDRREPRRVGRPPPRLGGRVLARRKVVAAEGVGARLAARDILLLAGEAAVRRAGRYDRLAVRRISGLGMQASRRRGRLAR